MSATYGLNIQFVVSSYWLGMSVMLDTLGDVDDDSLLHFHMLMRWDMTPAQGGAAVTISAL
jgi:hypothetical protein